MKATKGILAVLTVLLMAGATSALAQTEEEWGARKHMVTGFVGDQIFDLSDNFEDFGANFQKEVNIGGRYQYNITPRWGVEGSVLFTPVNAELRSLGSDVSVDTWYYNGNVVFNILPHKRWNPYVTGGAGAVTLDVQSGGDTETYFAGNFGGGLQANITPRIGFRIDARDYIYTADSLDTKSLTALSLPGGFDETIHDLAINFGVTIGF